MANLPSLEDDGAETNYAKWEQCGSIKQTEFDGSYVVVVPPPAPTVEAEDGADRILGRLLGGAAFEITQGRIRRGISIREELCLLELYHNDRHGLLALALHHEDVDDPGDASLIYVRLQGDSSGLGLAVGEQAQELLRPIGAELERVSEHPLLGLDWRGSDSWELPFYGPSGTAPPAAAPCQEAPLRSFQGSYELDVDKSLGAPVATTPNLRLTRQIDTGLLLGARAGLLIRDGHLQTGAEDYARRDFCAISGTVDSSGAIYDGTVAYKRYASSPLPDRTVSIRLTRTNTELTLRVASDAKQIGTAPLLHYRALTVDVLPELQRPR